MKKLAMIAGLLMASISAMAAPPSVPTGLTAVTNTPTSATLSWNSVTGVGIKYNIYQNGTLLGSNAATTAQVSGLVTGVQYGFGVQAYNINNEASAVSPYITITAGAGVTPTGQVQNVYCVNCTSSGGGGGGAVTQGTVPWVSSFSGALPTGTNYIGAVGVSTTVSTSPSAGFTWTVSNPGGGTFSQADSISRSVASLGAMIDQLGNVTSYLPSTNAFRVLSLGHAYNYTTGSYETLTMRNGGASFNDPSLNTHAVLYARDAANTAAAPVRIGQNTMANSLPVALASDQTRLGVTITSITATERLGVSVTAALPAGTNYIGAVGISNTVATTTTISSALPAGTNYIGAVGVSNTVATRNALNANALQVMQYLGLTDTTGVSTIRYASITFTATSGSANGITIASAVSGKTIVVISYTLSTNTAARLTLHHQGAAAVRSNTASNIIGGGLFPANGGESKEGVWKPGLAQNQPVCLDVSAAVGNLECAIAYVTY